MYRLRPTPLLRGSGFRISRVEVAERPLPKNFLTFGSGVSGVRGGLGCNQEQQE